ncbi:hypothetical protein [Nitrospirillum sp. BR 11163]|uniref:hypothetical protein n=1 Tax=Nitrospirillum sp. BR 11163 TaxID=3104323 RepID=UPI002B003B43|nr:hypothetical protein [Nitrospirillum sp. BR 11163]MEA1677416.1 hypothetical protein [Nitrospirillum sp. BR 11163]
MSPFKRPTKPKTPAAKTPAPQEVDVPSSLDEVLAAGARDSLRRDQGYARFRAQADKAAAAADKGDDRAYRLLAEAIRQLLNDRR